MSRSVDEVVNVFIAVLCLVYKTSRLQLDGDSPLSFQVHIVQKLLFHVALRNKAGLFDEPVCQR